MTMTAVATHSAVVQVAMKDCSSIWATALGQLACGRLQP